MLWLRSLPIPPRSSYLLLTSLLLSLFSPDSMTSGPGSPPPHPAHNSVSQLLSYLTSSLKPPTGTSTPLPSLLFPMDCLGPMEKSPETHYLTVRLSSILSENHPARSHPCLLSRIPTSEQDHIFCFTEDTVSPSCPLLSPSLPYKTPSQLPGMR